MITNNLNRDFYYLRQFYKIFWKFKYKLLYKNEGVDTFEAIDPFCFWRGRIIGGVGVALAGL